MEREQPFDITSRQYMNLRIKRSELIAQVTEVELEMQRIEMGQKPHDLTPILGRRRDIFWIQRINFDESYREQITDNDRID